MTSLVGKEVLSGRVFGAQNGMPATTLGLLMVLFMSVLIRWELKLEQKLSADGPQMDKGMIGPIDGGV